MRRVEKGESRGETQKLEEKFANAPRDCEREFDWRARTGGTVEGEMKEKGGWGWGRRGETFMSV